MNEQKKEQILEQLGLDWIEKTEIRIQTKAENIKKTIQWIFGLGSSASIAGIFFQPQFILHINLLWLSIPILLLFCSFCLAVLSDSYIDPKKVLANDSEDVHKILIECTKNAKRYIQLASILLIIGVVFLPIVLSVPPKGGSKLTSTYFATSVDSIYSVKSVTVDGHFPNADTTIVRVVQGSGFYKNKIIAESSHTLDSDKELNATLMFDAPIQLNKNFLFIEVEFFKPDSTLLLYRTKSKPVLR